jgi:hypothetical protein
MQGAKICSAEPSSAKPDGLVLELDDLIFSRSLGDLSETTTVEPDDWRAPLICYLENPDYIADRNVRP